MQHHKREKSFHNIMTYFKVFDDGVWQVVADVQENGFSRIEKVDAKL